jgi:L-aminopeptidase/D-esterase-like protein
MSLYPGSLVDVAGLTVGHHTRADRPTGCTVVLCPEGAVCGVDVRGGAPGTRETDLLKSENVVDQVHALLLTGGSAFGLDAAGGVMRWLDERGHGLSVGARSRDPSAAPIRVPIVPAAVLFDLWVGDSRIRPGADDGYAACQAASADAPAQGSVGAGTGAAVGKLFGIDRAMKGGIGSASVQVGAFTVAALVAVNAIGDVIDRDGQVLAGARGLDGGACVGATRQLLAGEGPARVMSGMQAGAVAGVTAGSATTIGIVATDARLGKAQANKLASLAHHGLSRAIDPLTMNDGDTLFALATGRAGHPGDLSALGAMAAEVVARAIRNAVRAATGLPGLPSVSG